MTGEHSFSLIRAQAAAGTVDDDDDDDAYRYMNEPTTMSTTSMYVCLPCLLCLDKLAFVVSCHVLYASPYRPNVFLPMSHFQ